MAQITSPIKPSYYLLIEQCFSQDETPLVVESSLEMVVQLCQTELEKGIQELAEVWSGALGERIPLIALRVLDMVSQLHNDKQEDDSPEMEERRRVAAHTTLEKLAERPAKDEKTFTSLSSEAFGLLASNLAQRRERLFAVFEQVWNQSSLNLAAQRERLFAVFKMIWNQPATTLELLSFNLAAQREKSLAVSKKNWNQVTTAITNNMFRLLQKVNSAYTIFLSNIQALTATLGVHWQASRRIESIMPAPYPWLSGIMAACYYFALAVWLGELLVSLYHYCVVDFAVKRSVSALTLAALSWALDRAVPYTLGQGWRFATLLVLILLVVFAAMT